MTKVYHGSTYIVKQPICSAGRSDLDFGQGFYLTRMKEQAVAWASRITNIGLPQWLNTYDLNIEALKQEAICKIFTKYDYNWLNFIVDSREGKAP